MPKFTVAVIRTGYASLDIEVEANSEQEAEDKALEEAGSHVFSEHNSEYTTDGIYRS